MVVFFRVLSITVLFELKLGTFTLLYHTFLMVGIHSVVADAKRRISNIQDVKAILEHIFCSMLKI